MKTLIIIILLSFPCFIQAQTDREKWINEYISLWDEYQTQCVKSIERYEHTYAFHDYFLAFEKALELGELHNTNVAIVLKNRRYHLVWYKSEKPTEKGFVDFLRKYKY